MTVIPASTAEFLFGKFDGPSGMIMHVSEPEVFDFTINSRRMGDGICLEPSFAVWHRMSNGEKQPFTGVLGMIAIEEKGLDGGGKPGVTLSSFWDARGGDMADIVMPYKVERTFRDMHDAVGRLRRGYSDLLRCNAMPQVRGSKPTLIDALTAQLPGETADRKTMIEHTAALRTFVLEQAKVLLPNEAFRQVIAVTAPVPVDRSEIVHGKTAPGGGAKVFVLGGGKAVG